MSNSLRYLLLAAAIITAVWILYQIRKLKVKLDHAIFWIIFAILLAILGIFPEATYWLTQKLGVMSPANLIFLIIITLLLLKVFTLSMAVSQLEDKLTVMSAEVALRTLDAENRLVRQEEKTAGNNTTGEKTPIGRIVEESSDEESKVEESTVEESRAEERTAE